jgi:hypothetical protein
MGLINGQQRGTIIISCRSASTWTSKAPGFEQRRQRPSALSARLVMRLARLANAARCCSAVCLAFATLHRNQFPWSAIAEQRLRSKPDKILLGKGVRGKVERIRGDRRLPDIGYIDTRAPRRPQTGKRELVSFRAPSAQMDGAAASLRLPWKINRRSD